MTYDELIYYLRMGCDLQQRHGKLAADLIESLQEELQICRMAQVVMENTVVEAENERDRIAAEWAEVSQTNYQRAKSAEAKLAKAVEALRDAVYAWDNHNKTGDMMQGHWVTDARATLAEIEGEKG
jgi:hypothetical protein